MEYTDAIKYIDGRLFELVYENEVCRSKRQKERLDKEAAFLTTARKAIAYQIPEKIGFEAVKNGYKFEYPKCPRCDTLFTGNRQSPVCSECGQKLFWEVDCDG